MSSIRRHAITLIPGDGVGPEVALATQRILDAAAARAGVAFDWEEAEAGASVFLKGDQTGVPQATRDSIDRTRVALKGPLETPVGFGEKSANVTLRKLFETYANVRPARELPGIPSRYKGEGVDMIIVRENIEDLYGGIEHLQAHDVAQALKIITRKGSEKVIRFAYEMALREGRKKVTTASKANILKLTEGLFKSIGEQLAPEYAPIQANHLIIDNVAHQMVKDPAQFDVIVATNLHGDIISDLASGLIGGLGFASSANYGDGVAIFEAVHGSAPKYAGKNVINPTALVLSATSVNLTLPTRWRMRSLRHWKMGSRFRKMWCASRVVTLRPRPAPQDLPMPLLRTLDASRQVCQPPQAGRALRRQTHTSAGPMVRHAVLRLGPQR